MKDNTRMLTTTDNPYNPHTHFDDWERFDRQMGYNTLAYMARIMPWSDSMSEDEQKQAYEDAIDEIIEYNILKIYMIAPLPVN